MPHVILKMYAGRSAEEKARVAEALARAVREALGSSDAAVSVAVQEFAPDDWAEAVYRPDILETQAEVLKRPGYDPFAAKG